MSVPVLGFGRSLEAPGPTATARCTFYFFEKFRLDLGTGSLHREGRQVELRPKNFDLLLYLINNRGQLIPKQKCLEQVWPDCAVTDNVLTQGIAEIRKVLGDDPHRPSFIKTVPCRGYIFIAEVKSAHEGALEPPVEGRNASEIARVPAATLRWWNSPGMLKIFTSVVTGVFLGVLLVWFSPGLVRNLISEAVFSSSVQQNVLAVIPFEVESDAPGYEWLSRGVADMISSGLAPSPQLHILSYDRLVRYHNNSGSAAGPFRRSAALELAKKSGAAHVVTGTLRKEEGRIQLVVQLMDTVTREIESQRSAKTGRLDDILAVVEQLSLQILQDVLRGRGEPVNANGRHVAEVTTKSLPAYQHYVAALTKFQYGGKLGSDAALIELEKAIRIDPSFAMAYFKIAEIKEWRRIWGYSAESPRPALLEAARHTSGLPEKERLLIQGLNALSEDDSRKALATWQHLERLYPQYALDVGIPVRIAEIYLDWGKPDETIRYGVLLANNALLNKADRARLSYHLSSAFSQKGDLEHSLRYAQRSVSLWPLKDSPVFVRYLVKLGRAQLFSGHRRQALDSFAQARNLAGEDAVYLTNIGWSYYFAGETERALELSRLALSADPDYGNAFHLRGWIQLARGSYEQAAAALGGAYEKTPARLGSALHQIIGGDLAALYHSGVAYEKLGEEEKARRIFQRVLDHCEQDRQIRSEQGTVWPGIERLLWEALASLRLGRAADVNRVALELESETGGPTGFCRQMARLYALLGDSSRALNWLERAISRGDRSYQHIYDSPDFEQLRDHPRFYELVTRNLAGEAATVAQTRNGISPLAR